MSGYTLAAGGCPFCSEAPLNFGRVSCEWCGRVLPDTEMCFLPHEYYDRKKRSHVHARFCPACAERRLPQAVQEFLWRSLTR